MGAIFLGGFDLHTCTGSVVHSSSGDLILTAAHCMAKQFKAVFVPGFAHTAAPTNVWHIDAVYLDPLWVSFRDPKVDYAFARVSRPHRRIDRGGSRPWISGSTVTGVTGGLQRGGCTQWVSYSAPFNERTAALLARAETGGRGEAAPLAFLGC